MNEQSFRSLFHSGVQFLKKGMKEEALNRFFKVLKYAPSCSEAYNNVGIIYFNSRDYSLACRYFLKSLELNKKNARLLHNAAMSFEKLNEDKKSINYYLQAITEDPDYLHSHFNLAGVYKKLGIYEKALPIYQYLAAEHSLLSEDSQFMIDIIKGSKIPRAPNSYVKRLFDHYADYYDEHMKYNLGYNSPKIFAEIIKNNAKQYISTLDIGCGTGLIGEVLRSYSKLSLGLDISEEMISSAKRKNVYDMCLNANFFDVDAIQSGFLFECITMCDFCIYHGELEPLFRRVKSLIQPLGDFILNFEDGEVGDYRLDSSGRFIHNKDHVFLQLEKEGFAIKAKKSSYSRVEKNNKVSSIFIHAKSP